MRSDIMKRAICLLLTIVLLFSNIPANVIALDIEPVQKPDTSVPVSADLEGKTMSILGDSISTFTNWSNGTAAETTNSTISAGAVYYPRSGFDVTAESTWWYQAAQELGLEILVNNSWSGSCMLNTRYGTVGAYADRCMQLHDDTGTNAGEKPDIIAIFLGTNDYYTYPGTLGSYEAIDFGALITETEEGFAYAEPATTLEAYAISLHKIGQAYPEAEVYCFTLLPRVNSTSQPVDFNEDICQLAEKFGVYTVDLYNCGIQSESTAFYMLMGDNLHPDTPGMDAITNAFVSALLENSEVTTHDVSFALEGAVAMEGTSRRVVSGDGFETVLAPLDASLPLEITVTMGGQDVTAQYYADGIISIPDVTGALVITAKGDYSLNKHLQQLPDPYCGVNLWQALKHDSQYYSANGWETHSSGRVRSITFPVAPGDRLWASSFGAAGTNGGTMNGIRVTFFGSDGLLVSMSADKVYEEFSTNGCITVPAGAIAVSIPMWTDSYDWDVHFLCLLDGHLQPLPENICGDTNLWPLMDHDSQYYAANGWGSHVSGEVKSVTFRVNPGDRLRASSFGETAANGGAVNGIRVTYFTQCGVLESVSAEEIYREFKEHGYITVPEGAWAVSVPMWHDGDQNELYILNRDHSPVADPAVDATCTETGLTEGSHCGGCGEVLVEQQVVPAIGHSYDDGICTRCGAVHTSTFQILDTRCNCVETFTYEVGMTWKEWLNSKYNTGMGSAIAIWVSEGPDILGSNPYMDIFVNGDRADYDAVICEEDDIQLVRYQ